MSIVLAILLFQVNGSIPSCFAQKRPYAFSSELSTIDFHVKHMGVLTVNGNFEEFSGVLYCLDQIPQTIQCSIKTEHINTGDTSRDKTIRGVPYLDTDGFPEITFSSKNVYFNNKKLVAMGNLKIKSVSKAIHLAFDYEHDKEKRVMKIDTETTLKRSDFNLDFGVLDGLIGNEIHINLHLVARSNQ